jgi:hypothetical protein
MAVESKITFAWAEPGVINAFFSGHITGPLLDDAVVELKALVGDAKIDALFVDTTLVSGFDPDVASAGRLFLGFFKERGVAASVAIAPNSLVRMMGSAIALATGLSMRFFGTPEEARAALAKMQARSVRRA